MRSDLSELRRNQPSQPKGSSEHDNELASQRLEWEEEVNILTASLLEEDRCFHNPLDDEWGENLDPHPHVLAWFSAPGGPYELEELQRMELTEGTD